MRELSTMKAKKSEQTFCGHENNQKLFFKDFCPYRVDMEEFREAVRLFSKEEWIDIILGAIDYNADGYADESQKLAMITRLLPFVEKRLNLIELAPKGTGKSYLFGSVSRYGWLASGGVMSRARMFIYMPSISMMFTVQFPVSIVT